MRYNRTTLLIAVLVLALTTNAEDDPDTGPEVNCYVCNVADDVECVSLESFKSRSTYSQPCETGCAVRFGEFGEIGEYDKTVVLARGCYDLEQCEKSNVHCCKCNVTDCNINNYCSTANTFHPKVVAAIIFCIARQSRVNLL